MKTRTRTVGLLTVALLGVGAAGCEFDPTVDAPFPVLQSLVIHDPAPAGANCAQRARAMMWLIHQYDAELWPRFAALPTTVNTGVQTPNGPACEYLGVALVRVPANAPTVPWFVMAMNESDWITECSTPLLRPAPAGQPFPSVGAIRFVRGQAGCAVGSP